MPRYMVPEWLLDRGITYRTDMFSYGMVLLEIIRGSRNVDHCQDSENWYFPSIAFKKARQGRRDELHRMLNEDELRDVVLLVFANKQDLPNAMNTAEITDKFGLHSLCQRH